MELFLEISSSKYIVKTSEYPVLDRGITNGTVTCDVILQTGKLTSRMNNTCTVPGIVNALLDSTD